MGHQIQPIEWVSISGIGLLTMIVNILILITECKKRKSKQTVFTTKELEIWSLLCIICGVLFGFSIFVHFFDGFCHFIHPINVATIANQMVFMGFYQLSRLNYCFSQNKIYSNKGYPNCLFIIMYLIGILWIIYTCIYPWIFTKITIHCGINKNVTKYSFVEYIPLILISAIIYLIWDFITLLLYIIKRILFKKFKLQQINIYNRILSILNRILILTILYEIMLVLASIIAVIYVITGYGIMFSILYWISWGLVSNVMSYSMFMMQQHNTNQYREFLKILYKLKLYNLCCCCKLTIMYELELNEDDERRLSDITGNKDKNTTDHDTIYETRDISIKNKHSDIEELSPNYI